MNARDMRELATVAVLGAQLGRRVTIEYGEAGWAAAVTGTVAMIAVADQVVRLEDVHRPADDQRFPVVHLAFAAVTLVKPSDGIS